jgi:hypothetical protein
LSADSPRSPKAIIEAQGSVEFVERRDRIDWRNRDNSASSSARARWEQTVQLLSVQTAMMCFGGLIGLS